MEPLRNKEEASVARGAREREEMRSRKHGRWVGREGRSGRVLGHSKELGFSSECDGKLPGGLKQ